MGGFGSGAWRSEGRKTAVEECAVLDVAWLTRERVFDPNGCPAARIAWRGRLHAGSVERVLFVAYVDEQRMLMLHAGTGVVPANTYWIPLTTTPLPWGGKRWYFRCPLAMDGVACHARVGKLYMPPGSIHFGCRSCFDLTYQSCRNSRQYDCVAKQLGIEARGEGLALLRQVAERHLDVEKPLAKEERKRQRRERRAAMGWA